MPPWLVAGQGAPSTLSSNPRRVVAHELRSRRSRENRPFSLVCFSVIPTLPERPTAAFDQGEKHTRRPLRAPRPCSQFLRVPSATPNTLCNGELRQPHAPRTPPACRPGRRGRHQARPGPCRMPCSFGPPVIFDYLLRGSARHFSFPGADLLSRSWRRR